MIPKHPTNSDVKSWRRFRSSLRLGQWIAL